MVPTAPPDFLTGNGKIDVAIIRHERLAELATRRCVSCRVCRFFVAFIGSERKPKTSVDVQPSRRSRWRPTATLLGLLQQSIGESL